MDSLLSKNLEAMKDLHAGLIQAVRGSEGEPGLVVESNRAGDPVPLARRDGKLLPLHSKFDPRKEAARFIGQIDTERFDLFVVLGFAFAYHVEELLKKMGDGAVCLVLEKSAAMVREAASHRDLSALFSDPRLAVLADPDEETLAEALRGKASRTVSFITHRGSHAADPDYYRNALELARSFISTKDVNIATLAKFEKIWSANIARNINRLIDTPAAGIFFDRFRGIPALVIAAGPSLLESIDFIRENARRCVLVAVDTSYRILLKHGIEPHFCLTVDPQLVNARYFEGTGKTGTVLIADPVAHPAAFRLFRGRPAATGLVFRIMKWIEGICGERGELTHGGSVSTNAYDFARRLGAAPVVMVGQDLSFTGGYAHARGSYLDCEIHLRTNRLYREEMFNRAQLTALPKIMVRGIGGEKVHTNQKMMIFLSWFEKRRDPNLVNATARGAFIPGIQHRNSADLRFEDPGIDIGGTVRAIYDGADTESGAAASRAGLLATVKAMIGELEDLVPVLERAIRDSESLSAVLKEERRDQGRMRYLLKRLDEADREVESKRAIKEIVSLSMQRVIHTITEGYEVEGEKGTEEERVAERSRYLYRGLLESAVFTGKVFGKMARLLERS